ncbi:hypothetical protein CS0771_69860 [Catellatospora sp. IY07-71]|uniref:hypothetical protein n=1 Tax=Catellatospora sp. IY07-71 TaxID=2728827 RepID=UPI001BB3E32D|nr:hypothetical protein [Catellatospora sp. IY07-71]BCJ77442.1 hypothetical protein CS0771_69860 [Catellatospora sp. IY07-71]
MSASGPADCYLAAADGLLIGRGPAVGGWWPKACACLIRLALETAIDGYWQRHVPAVAAYGSGRTKLLLLRRRCDRGLVREAAYAWGTLSQATHHHPYELAPTHAELRRLHSSVSAIVSRL